MQDIERDMDKNEYFVKYLDEKFKHLDDKVNELRIGQDGMRAEMQCDRQSLSDFKMLVLEFPIKKMLEDIEALQVETDVPRFLARHSKVTNVLIQWIVAAILLFATGGSIISVSDFIKEKRAQVETIGSQPNQNSMR